MSGADHLVRLVDRVTTRDVMASLFSGAGALSMSRPPVRTGATGDWE